MLVFVVVTHPPQNKVSKRISRAMIRVLVLFLLVLFDTRSLVTLAYILRASIMCILLALMIVILWMGRIVVITFKFQGMIRHVSLLEPLSQDCMALARPPKTRVLLSSHACSDIFSHHPIARELPSLMYYIFTSSISIVHSCSSPFS